MPKANSGSFARDLHALVCLSYLALAKKSGRTPRCCARLPVAGGVAKASAHGGGTARDTRGRVCSRWGTEAFPAVLERLRALVFYRVRIYSGSGIPLAPSSSPRTVLRTAATSAQRPLAGRPPGCNRPSIMRRPTAATFTSQAARCRRPSRGERFTISPRPSAFHNFPRNSPFHHPSLPRIPLLPNPADDATRENQIPFSRAGFGRGV